MRRESRLVVIPGTWLNDVERLLETAPRPTSAKTRAAIARGKRIIAKVRKTRIVGLGTK